MKRAQKIWTVIWALIAVLGLVGMIWDPSHIFTTLAAIVLFLITTKEYNDNDEEYD